MAPGAPPCIVLTRTEQRGEWAGARSAMLPLSLMPYYALRRECGRILGGVMSHRLACSLDFQTQEPVNVGICKE